MRLYSPVHQPENRSKKAKTARLFDVSTGDLGKASQPGGPLYQIEVSTGGLITLPGDLPITDGSGKTIGGVSGSSVEDAHAVVEARMQTLAGS